MMLKVVLVVAAFAVVVNSYVTSRTHSDSDSFGTHGHLEHDFHERGMRQTRQGQEEQWGQKRYSNEESERRGERQIFVSRKGGYTEHKVPLRQGELWGIGEVDQGKREKLGNMEGYGRQTKPSSNENMFSSQEDSSESDEIKLVQKQYHDTDTEYARNGKQLSNVVRLRGHKANEHHLQDSQEMMNKIYKDN